MKKLIIPIVIFLFITVMSSVFVVSQTEQAVVLQFGKPVRSINEKRGEGENPGLHFKLPFFLQEVRVFDKRLLELRVNPGEILSSDKKNVIVDAFTKFRIVDPLKFYQTLGNLNVAPTNLQPIFESRLKSAVNSAQLNDLLTPKRVDIMKSIQYEANKEALEKYGIEVVDVRITRTDLFGRNLEAIFKSMKSSRAAVSNKIRAEGVKQSTDIRSDADRQVTEMLATAKKDADIIKGKGDGEATRIYAEAYSKDPEFYKFFRSMQAYREALVPDSTTMLFSTDGEFMTKFKDSRQ